jgi:hypothetical protein
LMVINAINDQIVLGVDDGSRRKRWTPAASM